MPDEGISPTIANKDQKLQNEDIVETLRNESTNYESVSNFNLEIDLATLDEVSQSTMRMDLSTEESIKIDEIMQNIPPNGTLELEYYTNDVQTVRVIEETPELAVSSYNYNVHFIVFHFQHELLITD